MRQFIIGIILLVLGIVFAALSVSVTASAISHAQSANVYFHNCQEAKAAGAAPMRQGDPGYRTELDKDKDGVACE